MDYSDNCILDLIYHNVDPQSFVKKLYQQLASECAIDFVLSDEDIQIIPANRRAWNYIVHIVEAAADHSQPYSSVVAIQFALNREEKLQTDIAHGLNERHDFFKTEWLPFLARSTTSFTCSFNAKNASEIMQLYVNTMMHAWNSQRIPKPPTIEPICPPIEGGGTDLP